MTTPTPDLSDLFATGLRLARESRGLSLSAAARGAGITKAHLHDLEAGRSSNPCVSTLAGLAKAYCLPIGWLAEQASRALISQKESEDV
jgi:transcriptional regulator with XRE-family HTH domain